MHRQGQQQGIMSAYQLGQHDHSSLTMGGAVPLTSITGHSKVVHDALLINAGQIDGIEGSAIAQFHAREPISIAGTLTFDNTWRDLDVTVQTSATAKYALISMYLIADSGHNGKFQIREKGKTLSAGIVNQQGCDTADLIDCSFAIVKLDGSQVFQYRGFKTSAPNVGISVWVVGWIEGDAT